MGNKIKAAFQYVLSFIKPVNLNTGVCTPESELTPIQFQPNDTVRFATEQPLLPVPVKVAEDRPQRIVHPRYRVKPNVVFEIDSHVVGTDGARVRLHIVDVNRTINVPENLFSDIFEPIQ